MKNRYLAIYLQDHHAGATAGVELSRRMANNNRGTPLEADLARVAAEIVEDRRTLEGIMERLKVPTSQPKVALAWASEKVGRLKLNGRLLAYSPLSRMEELEAMSLGIEGKIALWRALEVLQKAGAVDLGDVALDALVSRAERQREILERHRLETAAALAAAPQ